MRPCGNVLTGSFSSSHKGFDFDDIPDNRAVACLDGVVQQSVFKYSNSWLQGRSGDPTPESLTTEDYGNFLKIKHADGTFSLYAHLSPDGPKLEVGAIVKRGQVIARIGHTGNSTGAHLHFEFRNSSNQSISVSFDPYQPISTEKTYSQQEWQVERDERNKNWDLYQAQIKETVRQAESFREQIKTLTQTNKDQGAELTKLLASYDELNRQFENYKKEVESAALKPPTYTVTLPQEPPKEEPKDKESGSGTLLTDASITQLVLEFLSRISPIVKKEIK